MVRFVHLFNYAKGVSAKDGEAWYLDRHVPRVRKLPGVVRYRSWQAVEVPKDINAGLPTPSEQFVRRSEVCFDDLEAAWKVVMGNPSLWRPSQEGRPGFREFECMFLDEEPQYNLLQDTPQQQYKYMSMPLWWPKGRPQVDETEDIVINSYCLFYGPGISTADGEDWYLGHHTREGKQLPGVRHYRTWKTIRVPEEPKSSLQPNKWFRLTELGLSFNAYRATMINAETRIRFEPSPLGPVLWQVIGGWLNIFIKLQDVQDLLK
jgi:hypothetical protein